MIPSQPTDVAQQPENVASRPSWKQISLRAIMVFTAGFAFTLRTVNRSENPVTDGLIAAFLVIWFWRQYEDSRTPMGAVCGLPTMLIGLLAGQSLIAFWALREFGKRWALLGYEVPGEVMIFPLDAINEIAIWFPVLITALPANTTPGQAPTSWNSLRELLGGVCGLVLTFILVAELVSFPMVGIVSIRGIFLHNIASYDGTAEERATELLFHPSLVTVLLACGGVLSLATLRFVPNRIGTFIKASAMLTAAISISISWDVLTRLMPATAPLVFKTNFEFHPAQAIVTFIIAITIAVLALRHQLPGREVCVVGRWWSWRECQVGWFTAIFRQAPVLLGLLIVLSNIKTPLMVHVFWPKSLLHTIVFALWEPFEVVFNYSLRLPIIIAFIAHFWRLRRTVNVSPPTSAPKIDWALCALDTFSAVIHLAALALALYVFAYTVQIIRESPLDWIAPRPFLKAEENQ